MSKELKTHPVKGIFYSITSALSVTVVYIISKFVQNTLSTELFLFWWFGLASVWGSFFIIKMKIFKEYVKIIKRHIGFLSYFAISESFGTFLFFYLIKKLNPSVVSFLGSITPLLVVIVGYFILNEKFNLIEGIGAIVAIIGVGIITYTTPEVKSLYLLILFIMLFIFAFNTVLVRKKSTEIPSLLITILRVYFLFTVYALFILMKGGFQFPAKREMINLLIGSFTGPILGMFLLFKALSYMKAGTVSIIRSIQPFLVAIGTYFILKLPLSSKQLIGGTIVVIGINIILFGANITKNNFLNRPIKN